MTREQFRRTELAYALTPSDAPAALGKFPAIAGLLDLTHSGPHPVQTLYFDDPFHTLYRQGRDNADEQLQVRIRSYEGGSESRKYIEIKTRTGKSVDKLRTAASIGFWGDSAFLSVSALQDTDPGILDLFHKTVEKFRLRPTLLMLYRRTALNSRRDDSFRLTADEGLVAKDVVAARWDSRPMRPIGFVVFELKVTRPMSAALSAEIERLSLGTPQHVSKFEKCTEALFNVGS